MRRFTAGLSSSGYASGALIAATGSSGFDVAVAPASEPLGSSAVMMIAPVMSSMTSCASSSAVVSARRHLKIAKSVFGFYLGRQGQRKYPFHRRPFFKGTWAMNLNAPHYWSFSTTKSQANFLPEENYITGEWTGKFFSSSRQVYTLQHATSGAKCRMRRFPSTHEFNNPSRWNIGKELYTMSKPRMDLIDEQMLTKKQRLDYVKAGLLPK